MYREGQRVTRDGTVTSLVPLSAVPREQNAGVFNSVVNRLFSSGLTLAGVLSARTVDDEVRQRLTAVLAELDEAVRELRTAALANVARDLAPPAPAATLVLPPAPALGRGDVIANPRRHAYAGIAGFARSLWVEDDA